MVIKSVPPPSPNAYLEVDECEDAFKCWDRYYSTNRVTVNHLVTRKVDVVGGCGVFAPQSRGFAQGEVLFEEAPTLLVRHAASKEKTTLNISAMMRKIREMDDGIHRLLVRLNYPKATTNSAQSGTVDLRFWTNAFDAPPSRDGREQSGLYLAALQFNHACIPNAMFSDPDPRNGYRMTLRATANISPGEETSIPYIHFEDWESHEQRQQAFRENYHSDCICWVCTQPGVQIAKRYCRRQQVLALRNQLRIYYATGSYEGELRRDVTLFRRKVEQELGVPRPTKDACMPPSVHPNLIDA